MGQGRTNCRRGEEPDGRKRSRDGRGAQSITDDRVANAGCRDDGGPARGAGPCRIPPRSSGIGSVGWLRGPRRGASPRAKVVSSRSATLRAPDARLHQIEIKGEQIDAAEPTLGLTNKGNLYYMAFQGNTRIEVVR
jgi:hypothetical protein